MQGAPHYTRLHQSGKNDAEVHRVESCRHIEGGNADILTGIQRSTPVAKDFQGGRFSREVPSVRCLMFVEVAGGVLMTH